ncbi:MAG: hypothetical protein ACRDDZ_12565 [Marinifilaceae bacterium]
MKKYIFLIAIMFLLGGCDKEILDDSKPPDTSIELMFIDQNGNNLIESKQLNLSNIKMISYQDGEEILHTGEEHVHYYPGTNQVNHQCFGINGISMHVNLNIPFQDRLTSRTYFRIKDNPVDTLYTIYNKEIYPYRKEEVYLNGKLIWNDIDRGVAKIIVNMD